MPDRHHRPPNIVLIMTDQERLPRHFDGVDLDRILSARARMRREGLSFDNYYVNSVACTSSRACMLTGLYTHQTWLLTNTNFAQPDLSPAFPTYARALKALGYETVYHGKWHLSSGDTDPKDAQAGRTLEGFDGLVPYGFDRFEPPHEIWGSAGEGMAEDAEIAKRAAETLRYRSKEAPPLLAVVSLVNPHDIMYYPRKMDPKKPAERYPGLDVPANFESLAQLHRNKPSCQAQYRELYDAATGLMPANASRPSHRKAWIDYLEYYLWLQELVDDQIHVVLQAIDRSAIRGDTIVIFTSDHGDMIGSHGLKSKACFAYDENIRVPLTVIDHTHRWIDPRERGRVRPQLCSSLDLFPTLLELADPEGASNWAGTYGYLPGESLGEILRDPAAPGRDHVLMTYDLEGLAVQAPDHVLAYIDDEWKGVVYSEWGLDGMLRKLGDLVDPRAATEWIGEREYELYPKDDPMETVNLARRRRGTMRAIERKLERLLAEEVRAPLPPYYQRASDDALTRYIRSMRLILARSGKDFLPTADELLERLW